MGKALVIMRRESVWQSITKHKENRKQQTYGLFQLVLFELLYKGFFALLMLPLFEFSLRFAIRFSGYSYITLENLVSFVCKPTTLLIILFLLTILLLFSFVEIISVIIFYRNKRENYGLEIPHILFPGVKKAFSMLREQNIVGIALATALFTGIANIPLWICLYMRFSILRFLLASVWNVRQVRIVLIILLALFAIVGLLGTFTMHYCCIKGTSFRRGMVLSIRALKKHPLRLAGKILLRNLFLLFIEALIYSLGLILLAVVTLLFVPETRMVAFLLKAEAEWQLYGGMLATTISLVYNLKILSKAFYELAQEDEKEDSLQTLLLPPVPAAVSAEEALPQKMQKRSAHKLVKVLTILVLFGNIINIVFIVRNGSLLENEILWDIAITAHRGDSREAPENTLSSVELAIENLADYAEIDVQETKDGVVVLMHDYSLKRTTGEKQYIWNVTYDELSEYDCGSWFSAEYQGERIPTLEQILELCRGRINLNIEIKDSAYNQALEEKVVALIEEFEFENQCVITSTSLQTLDKIKQLNENLKTGYIMSVAYGNFYERENIDFFSMKSSFVTAEVISKAHSLGKEVHVWTVNSRSELERVKSIGVDNIITDVPLLAREIVSGNRISNSFGELLQLMMQN